MYLHHYGLNKKPFEISPDPDFQWLGEKQKEALALLKCGIVNSNGFLVITGDVGTGKTALIKRFVKMAKMAVWVVTVPDPDMSKVDFYNILAEEFNMGRKFRTKGEFLIHIKHFLLRAYKAKKKILLIIDESQRLSHQLLEEIRLLSTIDYGGRMLLNIFFVGQNEFKTFLMEEKNKAIRDRITASYHLKPLTETEVFSYLRYRLRVAGGTKEIFTPLAVKEIYYFSGGYPRAVNIICDCALLSGYVKDKKKIDSGIIKECATELDFTIAKYRSQNDTTQSTAETPAIPVAEAQYPTDSIFQKQEVFRSAPVIVMFALFFGFIIYLLSNSVPGNFVNRTNYRTAVQMHDGSALTKQASKLNEYSNEEPVVSDTEIDPEPESASGRRSDELPPLKSFNLEIDNASSFGILLPDNHAATKKNEKAASEDSIDR